MNLRMLRLHALDRIAGLRIHSFLSLIEEEQYLPDYELTSIRNERLQRVFEIAHRYAPSYQHFDCYEDLPPLSKQAVRKQPASFMSPLYKGKRIQKYTSGSTGTPFKYQTCTWAQSFLWAGLIHSWQVCGYRFGDRVGFIAGSSLVKPGLKHRLFYRLMNIDTYPVAYLTDGIIKKYLQKIEANNTKVLYGYATAINMLADYLLKYKISPPACLSGIICTAEMLNDNVRANLEKAFGVKIYNQYGCNEAGISAFECEHGSLHLISSRCMYEVSQDGHLLGTDLFNRASLFLKYDTTDLVAFAGERCSCGRIYPVINTLIGRSDDVITDMNDKKIHCAFFNFLFKNDCSLHQYQIVYDRRSIRLILKVNEHFTENDRKKYLSVLKEHLCFDRYEVVTNEPFVCNHSLKHTFIIKKDAEPVALQLA